MTNASRLLGRATGVRGFASALTIVAALLGSAGARAQPDTRAPKPAETTEARRPAAKPVEPATPDASGDAQAAAAPGPEAAAASGEPAPSPKESAGLPVAKDPELEARLAETEATVAELRAELRRLQEKIERQQASPASPPGPVSGGTASAPDAAAPSAASGSAALSDHGTQLQHRETVRDDHLAAPRPGNASTDPDFPGFIPLFGAKAWIKLGGYAKLDVIVDSTKVGNPNKFATATIPVAGDPAYDSPEQFNIHAKQTRVSLDVRSATPLGALRVYYENDFYGDGLSPNMVYNLRHFYGQLANLTVGQAWTTFFDPDAIPDTLDFAGPGVQPIHRQPQIRYMQPIIPGEMHLAVAAEAPNSDVGNLPDTATTRNIMPDFAAHWRWEGAPGHLQVGGLARLIAYEDSAGPEKSTFGWGATASGVVHTWDESGFVGNAVLGDGIGRYMQDLGGASGAIVDADGELDSLFAWGLLAGYRQYWAEQWRSQFTYGYLRVDSESEQGGGAYRHTHYGQANLIWSPLEGRFNVGVEYLFGAKVTRDLSQGIAHRGQFSAQYKLF